MLQPRIRLRPSQLHPQRLSSLCRTLATATTEVEPAPRSPHAVDFNEGGYDLRRYRPRTPGLRHLVRNANDHLWKGRAFLPLTFARKGQHIGGRNSSGQIHVRHRGGGHKRRIRIVDFSRMDEGKHYVERIEYDPGRSAHIALISNPTTQKKSYILANQGLRAGEWVQSFRKGVPQEIIDSLGGVRDPAMISAKIAWKGNCLPIHMISPGTSVFNVGLRKGRGGQLCRSAGTYAVIMAESATQDPKWKNFVNVKLQSGEVRRIHRDCCATIGVASNAGHNRQQLGKAGRKRWLGIRPTVRGVAMNASEHPHGGGRGKSKGNVHPISIWGRTLAKGGYKTRKKSNVNKAVVTPRPRNFGRRKRDQATTFR